MRIEIYGMPFCPMCEAIMGAVSGLGQTFEYHDMTEMTYDDIQALREGNNEILAPIVKIDGAIVERDIDEIKTTIIAKTSFGSQLG